MAKRQEGRGGGEGGAWGDAVKAEYVCWLVLPKVQQDRVCVVIDPLDAGRGACVRHLTFLPWYLFRFFCLNLKTCAKVLHELSPLFLPIAPPPPRPAPPIRPPLGHDIVPKG